MIISLFMDGAPQWGRRAAPLHAGAGARQAGRESGQVPGSDGEKQFEGHVQPSVREAPHPHVEDEAETHH
jgi:hypothetical protein